MAFHLQAWHWIALGLALALGEMVLPTNLLLWFGIAGVLTGLIVAVVDIAPAWQTVIFAGLALVSYFPVRWTTKRLRDTEEPRDDTLNRRGRSAIGHQVPVIEAIENGYGAVKVGDSRWRASCETDVPIGARVEVYDVEGTTLKVRPVAGPPTAP